MLKSAAVMRTTWTSNAMRDPDFKDYLRKLKAYMISSHTWDIPFSKEDDIDFILEEIKEDFGYPIQIFEVLESPEITTDGRRYDMYARACVSKVKIVDKVIVTRTLPSLHIAAKIKDVIASIEDGGSKRDLCLLKTAAQNLKVGRQFIIAATEELVQSKGNIGVTPEIGDVFKIKHPQTGEDMEVELDKKLSGKDLGKYVVVDNKTDKKFIINQKALLQRIANPLNCIGEQGNTGMITISIDPESLKKLLQSFSVDVPQKEPESASFEYLPQDSEKPKLLVPAELDNPESDVGGKREGIESGPLEEQILQHLRGVQ